MKYQIVVLANLLLLSMASAELAADNFAGLEISGNDFFSSDNIYRSLDYSSEISPDDLEHKITIANRHRDKQLSADFSADGFSKIKVKDQKPWTLLTWLNNAPTFNVGDYRLKLDFHHSNVAGLDHLFTANYMFAPDSFGDIEEYGFTYHIPDYANDLEYGVHYSVLDLNEGSLYNGMQVKGMAKLTALQLKKYFRSNQQYSHFSHLTLKDRYVYADLSTGGFHFPHEVGSRALVAGYVGEITQPDWQLNFYADYMHNLSIGSHNSQANYTAARIGSDPNWKKYNLGTNGQYTFENNWKFAGKLEMQFSSEPLVYFEQISLGGPNNIRGFDEGVTIGDKGAFANLEIWTPVLMPGLQMYGFYDVGFRQVLDPQPTDIEHDSLASIGIGGRWMFSKTSGIQLDFARIVDGFGLEHQSGEHKLHVNILYGF